MSHQIR